MDAEDAAAHGKTAWPPGLVEIGAIRFARRCYRFEETVRFYRDLVGLPLHETFEGELRRDRRHFRPPRPIADLRAGAVGRSRRRGRPRADLPLLSGISCTVGS